jgi:uncharacterized membrane protein YoaK (UPF0700 family)
MEDFNFDLVASKAQRDLSRILRQTYWIGFVVGAIVGAVLVTVGTIIALS